MGGILSSNFCIALRDEKKIMGKKCARCSRTYVPPRKVCPLCFTENAEWVEVADEGILQSYTVCRRQLASLPRETRSSSVSSASARSFAKKYFAPGFLVRDPFDNLAVVRNYPEPVLVFHGKFDEVTPYSHGMALYKSAPHATMITYESGHNDCPPNWETFWRDLEAFLYASGLIKPIE